MKNERRHIKLTDLFRDEHFNRIQSGIRKNFKLQLETTDTAGKPIRKMQGKNCHPEFCKIVRSSTTGAKRCLQDRIRSLNLAIETGQPYTSICHAGIVLVCVPIMDGEIPLGGLFFGKCLWEDFDEDTKTDILRRLRGLKFDRTALINAASKLPAISGRKIHQASEFLFILLYETTELDPAVVQWRRQQSIQQSKISDIIHEKKHVSDETPYPYESERKLIGKVKIGDRTGAKEILNDILGTIMFQNPGDMNVLKARLVELLSILSRAAVEGGVAVGPLLERNLVYINKVLAIDTQAELCSWISSALNDFIESVYTSQDSQKIRQIRPAVEFIEANYDHQMSLADVASSVHLSVSRLAHLFKEQMGITVIDMLTNVRVDRAKELLLSTEKNCTEICFAVGYNNQSYFTRTFKEMTGLTPKQFREQNQRPSK